MGHDGRPTGVSMAAPVAEPTASKLLRELHILCAEGQPGATGPRPTVARLAAIARVFRAANDRLTATSELDGWRPAAPAGAVGSRATADRSPSPRGPPPPGTCVRRPWFGV